MAEPTRKPRKPIYDPTAELEARKKIKEAGENGEVAKELIPKDETPDTPTFDDAHGTDYQEPTLTDEEADRLERAISTSKTVSQMMGPTVAEAGSGGSSDSSIEDGATIGSAADAMGGGETQGFQVENKKRDNRLFPGGEWRMEEEHDKWRTSGEAPRQTAPWRSMNLSSKRLWVTSHPAGQAAFARVRASLPVDERGKKVTTWNVYTKPAEESAQKQGEKNIVADRRYRSKQRTIGRVSDAVMNSFQQDRLKKDKQFVGSDATPESEYTAPKLEEAWRPSALSLHQDPQHHFGLNNLANELHQKSQGMFPQHAYFRRGYNEFDDNAESIAKNLATSAWGHSTGNKNMAVSHFENAAKSVMDMAHSLAGAKLNAGDMQGYEDANRAKLQAYNHLRDYKTSIKAN